MLASETYHNKKSEVRIHVDLMHKSMEWCPEDSAQSHAIKCVTKKIRTYLEERWKLLQRLLQQVLVDITDKHFM